MQLKEKILAISIAIVFAFFVGYGINTFYKEPKYEDYCNQTHKYSPRPIATPYDTQKTGCSDPWINKEVDEIIVLDIGASRDKKHPDFDFIKKLASECFMPICYGGGLSCFL